MAIINRDGDKSEKKEWVYYASNSAVAAGSTLLLSGPIPFPFAVQSVSAISNGASGAPQLAFFIGRPGSGGMTLIGIGISNMVIPNAASFQVAGGYSGLAAQGSTLLNGNAQDVIIGSISGSNTACSQLLIQMVLIKTQDIVSHNGISS